MTSCITRRAVNVAFVTAGLVFLLLFWPFLPSIARPSTGFLHPVGNQTIGEIAGNQTIGEIAGNQTLGFGALLALSRGTSWRVHGLHAAAAYTGLNVMVPTQPYISDEYVRYFTSSDHDTDDVPSKPKHGSALAWIAHLDLLRHIVQSDLDTALIIEDDVDWSVQIKQQMITLSEKVREYTNTTTLDSQPYGSGWDVLWLGHCGEWYNLEDPPNILSWEDTTNGPREDWRGVYDRVWLKDLPNGYRHLFWSVSPICTYAYAVTRAGAQKILEWASDGRAEAFDIHLSAGCRDGGLRCISVVDELFHHYRPPPNLGQGSDILGDIPDELEGMMDAEMGSTAVILDSARCKALFDSECRDTSETKDRPYR